MVSEESVENLKIFIELPSSKSISNRLLILQALTSQNIEILDLSDAEDTKVLRQGLNSGREIVDIGLAGTAMRFLTSFFVLKGIKKILTGDERMQLRPIKPLVNVLQKMGAKISYLDKQDYPPIQLHPSKISGGSFEIDSDISSQFISSLMMIGPYLKGGLELNFKGNTVSRPYIAMTGRLMQDFGVRVEVKENSLSIPEADYIGKGYRVERDWSSAAFIYEAFALSNLSNLCINGLTLESIQGDSYCANVFEHFGVGSKQTADGVELFKTGKLGSNLEVDLNPYPDLIPAVLATAAGLEIDCHISGTRTLKNKESDRVEALKIELKKWGGDLMVLDADKVYLKNGKIQQGRVVFETYNDHRIAMCFAPFILLNPAVEIENKTIVVKSFPHFWKELAKLIVKL